MNVLDQKKEMCLSFDTPPCNFLSECILGKDRRAYLYLEILVVVILLHKYIVILKIKKIYYE